MTFCFKLKYKILKSNKRSCYSFVERNSKLCLGHSMMFHIEEPSEKRVMQNQAYLYIQQATMHSYQH